MATRPMDPDDHAQRCGCGKVHARSFTDGKGKKHLSWLKCLRENKREGLI